MKLKFHLRSHGDKALTWCGLEVRKVRLARLTPTKTRPRTPEDEICLRCRREWLLDDAEFRLNAYLIRHALWLATGKILGLGGP